MSSFEENIDIINKSINSKRYMWRLSALSYISFDDVAQLLRIHIYEKFCQWDQSRPIEPWLSSLILNRMNNLMRDNYGRVCPPCNSPPCKFNEGEDKCGFTTSGKKCSECPLYAKWEKTKKSAYNLKLPESVDSSFIGYGIDSFDIIASSEELNRLMFKLLSPKLAKAYDILYIKNMPDEEAAKELGFFSNEGRKPGYRQIANLRKKLIAAAKYLISNYDIIK